MIVVMLLTFDRIDYALTTLQTTAAHLLTDEDMRVHIADDGSSQEYRDRLYTAAQSTVREDRVSMTNSERRGYGASYNLATQYVHKVRTTDGLSTLVLPLEDDWELTRDLDLRPIAKVLRSGIFGCVRMGYIGMTQPLDARFELAEGLHWLRLNPDSPEPHVWAGHPRLETVEFERAVGPWTEGLDPGSTEFEVCHRPEARKGVGWPVGLIKPSGDAYAHIGAVQARTDQKEVTV